jgi:hypothetical protein
MNATPALPLRLASLERYRLRLEKYSLEQLTQKPADGGWSIGQIYNHTWMSARNFFFKNAGLCLTQEGVEDKSGFNWRAFLLFLVGKLPNRRYRMPKEVAVEPHQPASKEQLAMRLAEIDEAFYILEKEINASQTSGKVRHPLLGSLSARQWQRLCSMHYDHHFEQILRTEKALGLSAAE